MRREMRVLEYDNMVSSLFICLLLRLLGLNHLFSIFYLALSFKKSIDARDDNGRWMRSRFSLRRMSSNDMKS